jgi:F-type H+-transporting ATPase subunit b
MQRQISQAKQQLREEIGNLSVDIAEKILDKEIKKQDHKRLIEQFIDKLQDKK